MITGWGTEVDRTKMEENAVDFVISKPFDSHQILNAVTERMGFRQKDQYGTDQVDGGGNIPVYLAATVLRQRHTTASKNGANIIAVQISNRQGWSY